MKFNFDNERPIYLQLVEQLQLYIVSGKLPPGEKLPSVRDLSLQAKVNPNTMQRALSELENDKLIFTERTNGKYVTTNLRQIKKFQERFLRLKVKTFLKDLENIGCNKDDVVKIINSIKER